MLDINMLRKTPDVVRENMKKKFQDHKLYLVDEVIDLDRKNREAMQQADALRNQRKVLSKEIGGLMKQGKKDEAERTKEKVAQIAEELVKLFDPHFTVEVMISNKRMYQVSGVKRDPLAHSHFGVTHTHGGLTHTHTHGDEAHEHTPEENATPIQELLVLMRYLVSHNDAHAQEVADLARELQIAGKDIAYDEIMDTVADFDMVNAKLAAILNRLVGEDL